MRRWIVGCFIASYISVLGFGLACQTVRMGTAAHPLMYFIVWDMYCAWGAYNHGYRAVAEGVSGTYYDLNPPPWGAFRPFNTLDRFQSITAAGNQARYTRLVAANTQHEPIARMFVVEECWAKQYDLSENTWKTYNAVPYQPFRYTKVVLEQSGDGEITAIHPSWIDCQPNVMLTDIPRLEQEIRNSRNFFTVEQQQKDGNPYFKSGETDSYQIMRSPSTN